MPKHITCMFVFMLMSASLYADYTVKTIYFKPVDAPKPDIALIRSTWSAHKGYSPMKCRITDTGKRHSR